MGERTVSGIFVLARIDHDGDHVLCAVDGPVLRAWEICDDLNKDREPGYRLEVLLLEVRR